MTFGTLTFPGILGALLAVALGADDPPPPETKPRCEPGHHAPGWCESCRAGTILGYRVPSKILYDALDPHGHEIDPARIPCAQCRSAAAADGLCPKHRRGFVHQKLYHSRLTYLIAKAGKEARDAIVPDHDAPCAISRGPKASGWCDECGAGRIGSLVFRDRELYRAAGVEVVRLRAAIELVAKCEWCAVALFEGGRCPRCRISYRDGRPVPSPTRSRPSGGRDREPASEGRGSGKSSPSGAKGVAAPAAKR